MKNNNINNWNSFSRGICVALLIIAAFCGICGLGAAFNQIPWLLIAGGICLLLMISVIIWFLGYMSRKNTSSQSKGKYEIGEDEIFTFEPVASTSNENSAKSYRVVRQPVFDYDAHNKEEQKIENFDVSVD